MPTICDRTLPSFTISATLLELKSVNVLHLHLYLDNCIPLFLENQKGKKKKKTFWNIIKLHPSVMEYKQSGEMKTHLKIPLKWMRHATNTLYFSTLES